MPRSPKPPGERLTWPPSLVTSKCTTPSPQRTSMSMFVAPTECRRALVTASRAMRWTDAITVPGTACGSIVDGQAHGKLMTVGAADMSAIARRSSIDAAGSSSASVDSSRSAPTIDRIAASASPRRGRFGRAPAGPHRDARRQRAEQPGLARRCRSRDGRRRRAARGRSPDVPGGEPACACSTLAGVEHSAGTSRRRRRPPRPPPNSQREQLRSRSPGCAIR